MFRVSNCVLVSCVGLFWRFSVFLCFMREVISGERLGSYFLMWPFGMWMLAAFWIVRVRCLIADLKEIGW